MVRETRHLWVGNLPDSIREDRIRDHFKRYGRVQSVKLLGSRKEDEGGGLCATVSFMDIKSASKAHHGEHKLEDRILTTEYHEPPSIPSTNSIHYSSRYPSSEEVVGFERSHFYETGGREGRDYLSRRYHAEPAIPPRSRRQDARIYRNGPYTALISPTTERSRADHHGRSWGYESPRYTTTSVPTPQEIYPEERREASCLHSSKKHSKSRSGSDSASTASSRSRSSSPSSRSSSCSSATSSPASDKSCSTHSQHGSLRGNAGSVNASSINSSSPAIHNEDRRPLAICVRNLPARSSDTSLKDGLYHEYKKHGKVTWVKVVGQGSERYAVVCFKKTEDVDKALQVSHDKLFFGCKIDVAPYQGYDVDDNEFSFVCRPFEADQDEFHPKATRTLFIGNLEKDITMQEIRKHFDQFGEILDIDIKKQGTTSSSYAFCQYTDIASVVRAIRSLDGEHLGSTRVKLGFGKSLHTNCVWVDGISESVSEKYLSQHFSQFGPVSHVLIDRTRGQALISFEQITYAQQAVKEMRGVMLRGRKLQIDYASRECQEAFYEHMDKQSNQHSNYDTSVSGGVTGGSVRGFETPSSSSSSSGGGSASGRYPPSSRTYPQTGQASRCHSSPSRQRSSRQRYSEYLSEYPEDRRTSYRSYEDVISVEDGEARHKERVEIEECQSSGEEGSGRRKCKHRRSDGDSSRPGTPLCDERPEPAEPRRPRERTQDPLSLPLPRFATQVLPPPSPPSSDDSQPSPPSPEWEERLRSLDEKYRKWSGSRTNPTRPDPTSVRLRHRLLALDPHDLQPSDIVKSLLAKRSVFDEDLKRLENFGEKYEPKEFVPGRVLRSPGSPVQGKGLQYPFPSHPDPSRPPTSNVSSPMTTNTSPANTNNPPSFTKPQSQPPQQVPAPVVKSKAEKTEIKKDITSSLLVSSIKPKPFRRDSEPSEARRKSREEAPEVTKSLESAVKKDDTSDCDKVKDAQVCERRKSTAEKRRSSVDIKESNLVEVLEKVKDCSEKKELRRASCDSIESDSKLKDPRKQIHDSVDIPTNSDADKHKKLDSEYRKDTELGSKNSGNIDIDRKKDIFGVNSEKDRRRKDNAEGSSDNLKHKKVPETNKCDSLALKTDSDETKTSDREEKRKEEAIGIKTKENKKEQASTERERRRDSMDSDSKRPTKQDEFPKYKDVKMFNELKPLKKDSESEFNNLLNKKESEKEVNKTKESEKKKNSDSEISKETSLFKKVFGFTDSLRNKDNNKKTDNSMAKVETPDKQKEKKEVINECKSKKDLEIETRHKSMSRKSPDNQEVKHKDSQEKKKNSEVSERKKKDLDITSDDFLPKDFDLNYHNKRKVIERCLNREALNMNNDNDHLNKYSKEHDKKKDYYYDEFDALLESCKHKENENKHDNFAKDHKKKEYSHSDVTKNDKRINSESHFDSDKFFDSDRKADHERLRESKGESNSDIIKFKHSDKHSDRKRHQEFLENSKYKEDKKKEESHERHRKKDSIDFDNIRQKEESSKNNDRKKDHFDNNKFRDMDDAVRKRKDLESLEQTKPKETSERKKDILEKERRRDRELVDAKYKDNDEKRKDGEKEKKRKDIESHEKLNGDHIDCIFDSVEEHDQKDLSNKKEKKKDHRMNSWPASIGCKRRLSSQDSDLVDDAKRSKQERRDSKDSGKSSSSSSKKGDKHGKSFSRILEERIKEDKEHDKKKEDIELTSEEKHKKQLKKEKKIEKKKEEKKFRVRLKENGTASESDLNSADDELKNLKRQHSIFDIVDDEPAYISMYDKVKARSTKNMQKQEEEKRQEKLKEKFSQLKQSRAKREEKKRSTSYDGDSDSDHGGCGGLNRRNKLMITSSEDEGGSDCEIKLSSRTKKLTFDFSEDEGMLVTPKSRLIRSHNADHESRTRKILSDTSEDDVLRHSTPKLKTKVSIEMEIKSRKIMSDTSEDDTLKCLTRIKASRIQSDESDNEVDSYNDNKEPDSNQHHTNSVSDDLYSTREFTNHNIEKTLDHNTNIRSPSPEDFRRNSLDVAEMPRKKKKQKKQKNLEDGDGSSSKKHSSKKDKKKSHNKDDDENCKKSKKKKDRDNNKREEKMEDIFGPLSDDSDKALRWHVNQVKMTEVFRVDSDSELEIIRKKEKRRREKKARELDEAGRALEANLMMDPSETYQVVEPVKNKKKKRKKSRDEKIKHHHSESASLDQRIEEERHSFMDNFIDYTKSHQQKIRQSIEKELKISEKDEDDYVSEEFTKENRIDEDSQHRMEEEAIESILPHNNSDSEDTSSKVRPKSMSSLLDSPPPAAQQIQQQQQHSHQPKKIDIPGFRGLDVDEDIHETAVKSISESSSNSIQINEPKFEPEKTEQTSNDEKPTPVISQEETEDAVAALLMEDPFNGTSGDFESYTEDTPKPDTPASEPDLQIDTDAEETYDIDISKPPRTPDIPQSFYRQVDTREGLEERILPLVCPSDTPIKEEIKVLEVPRTPGSGLERKTDEDQPADIQPIKLNLDSPEKQIKEELETSDPQLCETETIKDIKNSSFVTKNELDEPMDTKETPIVPQERTDLVDKPKQESSDAIFDSLMRGSIINDSVKKELVKPPADSEPSNPPNSFVTKVVPSVPQPPEPKHLAELEPIVIKQNPASVVTQISKEVENLNVVSGDTAPKTSTTINKMIQSTPTPTQVSAAIQQANIATPEEKTDADVIRVSVGGLSQSCIKSPTRIVQVAPSSPVAIPQLHFSSNINSASSPLGLVRTSTIQTHPITPQTRPASPQVHHLTVIPNQQVRSPGSPLMMQHGLTPKPGSQVIQPTSGNPVIRHTVSSNVQPVKPASTIVVSQPNIQRQLQIVTQPSHLSPPNIKLVRTEQPSSPLNIVRLARPVMPNHCLPVRQSVPLLQPISTADIRPSIPLHDVKEPPSLIALQDKPIIQHTVSHISTPVNVIKNPLMEIPKVLDQTRDVKITHTFDRDSVPELKELTPPFPVGMDLPKDLIKQSSSFKNILNNEENSTSNDSQNYVLDDTKPLNAVIHDLASKHNSKHADEDKSIEKMNEIENDESEKQHSEAASGIDSEVKDHTLVKKPELVLPDDIISIRTDDSQDYEINKPELIEIKDDTGYDVEELKSDESNLNTKDDDLLKVDSPKVDLEEKIQEEKTVEDKEDPKKAEEPKEDEYNLDKAIDTSKTTKNHTDHPPENEELEKEDEPLSPMEVQEEARIEKAVIVKESGGTRHVRRRKRKVRLGPVRRAKNAPATPVKTSTDIYEFRDDSEEERPRLILTIKSPPDRSEPIKIKATPTTRKSRRLQEKDGGNCRKAPVVEHTVEGPVIKTSNRPGRRATRSTQPNLTVTLNPEPRKSPRRKHAQHAQPAAAPVEEKVVRMESPPTPPPTPAAAAPPSVLATPVVIPVNRPSTPLSTPAVPPTPPSSATPPASSTPPVSTPTPVLPTPNISSPPPPPSTTITTLSSVVVSTPIPTPSTSSPTVVSSTPPVSAPSTIVSVPVTSSTPPLITSTPLKVISKPTPTLVPHPVQTIQGSIPVNVSIAPNNNALQNRNSLEPTTLIDPVTGLLIPMQESEEGQYIPLHSDLNRAEGEPAKKRLRIHAEVTRPSVVRQVLPPATTVLTHNVQPQVCHPQQHQVVQPPVSQHHQVVQPPVSQHHQVVQPPASQLHQAVQPPVSQQPQVVDPPVSQHHQVVQPPVSQQHQVVQPPVSQHHQVVQPTVTQHHQGGQPLVPQHHQVLQPPVSQHHQVVQPPVSQHHQVGQPIVSQHHQVVQTPVSQHHQVVQPPMSQHHQIVQPQVSQHHHLQHPHLQTNQPHISQHQSHPPQHPVHQSQVSLHQLQVAHHAPSQHPMSQHQPPQHSMSHQPPQHHPSQSHMNAHPVCQPPKPLHHHQSLATVTPVLVSHQPPPLMPVSSPHHPSVGHHIQPSVQIQSITKPGPVSKSHSNIPLATVTVSTPKMLVSKSEPSTVKGLYPPHSIDSPSMAHPSVLHSVPSIPSVVHTTSSGHGVHGSVLQSGVPMGGVVNQRSMGAVHPAPAHSPALNPAPAHSPALHPTPAHSPVHPTPAHHPLIVRTVPHGLNPPAAHMQHAHAIHTPSHADSHRAVPSPAPGAPPGLPVACKPAPITPKAHLLQAVRPRASPSTAHPPPPKAHIHTPITNIRDGSLASTAGPLGGSSINSPPPRAAHQQPPTHLHNPPTPSPRVVIKPQIGSMERARETSLSVTSPQPRPSHVQPGLPMSASYEPSMHVDGIMGSSSHWGSQRSRQTPPPAHQHSSQGDVVQHFVNAHMQPAHYVPSQLVYPQWMGNNANNNRGDRSKDSGASSPPLELRRQTPPRPPYYETPPPAHSRPSLPRPHTPPHASQVPPQADSLIMLLQRHPVMWQGLLALKNDQAAVQMHFVFGNMYVARDSLPCNRDGSTPPLRIAQRMRLEQAQIDGVSRKMQSDNEHCMLLALPCGRDHMDVLQQSNNLQSCFITYLQQKQAAGIVNIAVSGSQQPAYVIHIFPSCEFANESLARIAPDLMHRVADIAHLLIVIATV